MNAYAETRVPPVRPRRIERIHNPGNAYRCRQEDVRQHRAGQAEWRDVVRQSGRRAKIAKR